ncbi:MAG: hypothetical protein HY059_22855 [Proteobacteria bacterium]|nr:hypothetical protein [Pseudomonadota bacterium]
MSLIKIDWNPPTKTIRQFGGLLSLFALAIGGHMLWRHKPAGPYVIGVGVPLGLLVLALPESLGRFVYRNWMRVAFVIGTVVSFAVMGIMYFVLLTPLAVFFRLNGRDGLRLKRPASGSHWVPMDSPDDIAYYERLY